MTTPLFGINTPLPDTELAPPWYRPSPSPSLMQNYPLPLPVTELASPWYRTSPSLIQT